MVEIFGRIDINASKRSNNYFLQVKLVNKDHKSNFNEILLGVKPIFLHGKRDTKGLIFPLFKEKYKEISR